MLRAAMLSPHIRKIRLNSMPRQSQPTDNALPRERNAAARRLLADIVAFCQRVGMAESTFGRLAVNDGKLVARLRVGGKIGEKTLERVSSFMAAERHSSSINPALAEPKQSSAPFRFYDNRQKYLLFVNTCNEKWVFSQRIEMELEHIPSRAHALRVFDAGVGDGTVMARVMRTLHERFPERSFYIVGKEISLEDVRLALDKMADRFYEHPATVLVMTNMYYSQAPWLRPSAVNAGNLVWREVVLRGSSAGQFEKQLSDLAPFLARHWTATINDSGNLIYNRPVALIVYREDQKSNLIDLLPKQAATRADFDLVIASQPYRAQASVEFKAGKVIAPLSRALGAGGRLIGIHSYGHDPGLEIVQQVWPTEQPFTADRHRILRATKQALGIDAQHFDFNAYSDRRALFKYEMHVLPTELSSLNTSTLLAAWNAAVYVAQIDDARLESAMKSGAYLDATRAVLQKHGGLWFQDESYVISRHRE